MKKAIGMVFTFLCMGLLCFGIPVEAKGAGGYNEYRGKSYESTEELEELIDILLDDGYVKVEGSLENELKENTHFRYNEQIGADRMEMYVNKRDLEDFRNGEYAYLNNNTVIISWYGLKDDAEQREGKLGNDIPAGVDRSYITVTIFLPEELQEEDNLATVQLINAEDNKPYYIKVTKANGWSQTTAIPSGLYHIAYATIGTKTADYPPKWHTRWNQDVPFVVDDVIQCYVGFGPVALPDTEITEEQAAFASDYYTNDIYEKFREDDVNYEGEATEEEGDAGMDLVHPESEEDTVADTDNSKKTSTVAMILFYLFIGIFMFGGIWFLYVFFRRPKDE